MSPSPSEPPRVTIVIPVYNGANYLGVAIDSALAQGYGNLEILVVNDGSTDGGATAAVARGYGDRIRYLEKPNGGVATALNLGIESMTGEYFSWLSHDDAYLPGKVAREVASLSGRPGTTICFCDYEFIDGEGRRLGLHPFRGRLDALRVELIRGDPVNGCTVLVPRRCFEEVGRFDATLRTIQDYDMWFRLANRFPFVHVPEVLVQSRLHPDQGVRTIGTHYAETVRTLARFVGELTDDEVRRVHEGPPSLFYSRLALGLKVRGFDDAARAALAVGRRKGAGDGAGTRLRFAAEAALCGLLSRKAKPTHWWRAIRSRARAGGGERR